MLKSFTIIIPMYNSSKFIRKALNSIIESDYDKSKIQVLIIDDGSTDNSKEIVLDEFVSKHNYFEYHYKKNGNWGSVINYVKNNKLAKNDIVTILDSDDLLTKKGLRHVNRLIDNYDILAGSYYRYNGKRTTIKIFPYYFLFKKIIKNKNQMQSPQCLPIIWYMKKDVFYKMHDLIENAAYQDSDMCSNIINNANSIIFCRRAVSKYYFNREDNSTSQDWDEKRFDQEYKACLRIIENDAIEIVSFRINVNAFRKKLKEKNIKFVVHRKFKFSWLPFYIRWMYKIYFLITQKKFFIYN